MTRKTGYWGGGGTAPSYRKMPADVVPQSSQTKIYTQYNRPPGEPAEVKRVPGAFYNGDTFKTYQQPAGVTYPLDFVDTVSHYPRITITPGDYIITHDPVEASGYYYQKTVIPRLYVSVDVRKIPGSWERPDESDILQWFSSDVFDGDFFRNGMLEIPGDAVFFNPANLGSGGGLCRMPRRWCGCVSRETIADSLNIQEGYGIAVHEFGNAGINTSLYEYTHGGEYILAPVGSDEYWFINTFSCPAYFLNVKPGKRIQNHIHGCEMQWQQDGEGEVSPGVYNYNVFYFYYMLTFEEVENE